MAFAVNEQCLPSSRTMASVKNNSFRATRTTPVAFNEQCLLRSMKNACCFQEQWLPYSKNNSSRALRTMAAVLFERLKKTTYLMNNSFQTAKTIGEFDPVY